MVEGYQQHMKRRDVMHKAKRWNDGSDATRTGSSNSTATGGSGNFTTIGITMTGTGTVMTMTTDIVTTPTTLAVAPGSDGGDTTYVVVMPGGSSSAINGSGASASGPITYITQNGTLVPVPASSTVSGGAIPGLGSTITPAVITITTGFPINGQAAQAQGASNNDGNSGSRTAAIVGATLGGAAFLVGLIAVIFAFLTILKRRNKKEDQMAASQYAQSRRNSQYPRSEARNSQYPATEARTSRPPSVASPQQ